MIDKPIIIGVGKVQCTLCRLGADPKDGLALEIDGAEQQFCWNHLKAMSRMWRNAWSQKPLNEEHPLLDAIDNGRHDARVS